MDIDHATQLKDFIEEAVKSFQQNSKFRVTQIEIDWIGALDYDGDVEWEPNAKVNAEA